MDEIQIITPPTADPTDVLDHGLVALTEAICQATGEEGGYGLGGRFGYGEDFENEVFVMRRFYWGDCDCGYEQRESDYEDSNPGHAENCYQTQLQLRRRDAGLSWHESKPYVRHDSKLSDYSGPGETIAKKLYQDLCTEHNIPWDGGRGCAVHCTCGCQQRWEKWAAENGHTDQCSVILPNFKHKRTGLEVRWYKWIGRDTETKNAEGVDLQVVFSECLASLPSIDGQQTERG
jgi:hypothetical protein